MRLAERAWAERGIWQRRFWQHLIRDDVDDARHVEYCHINPLKHGLVERVRDWPYSSFHRDVGTGVFPALIGAAISKRSVSSVSGGIGEANFTRRIAAWNGGLRRSLSSGRALRGHGGLQSARPTSCDN